MNAALPEQRSKRFSARFRWLIFICLCCINQLMAQSDSTLLQLSLPEATIQSVQFSAPGYSIWRADSLPTSVVQSLHSLLFLENGADIRQYAPGTLATVSIRGAGSGHSPVLWNGLNLQSPMNGVYDASLLPVWSGDKLECRSGGNSAIWGSGAMGGVLTVESVIDAAAKGWNGDAGYHAAGFGRHMLQGRGAYGNNRGRSEIRASYQSARNNFPFTGKDLSGQTITLRQENNRLEKTDIQALHQGHWKRIRWRSEAWWQRAFRQIPPALTETTAGNLQKDRSLRWSGAFEMKSARRAQLTGRFGWQDEQINFHFADTTEQSRAKTALIQLGWQQKTRRRINWQSHWSAQQVWARSDGYLHPQHWYREWTMAGALAGEMTGRRGAVYSVLLRREWINNNPAPMTWSWSCNIPLKAAWAIKGHFSRNFKYPTLNDRFWETLDSISLKPEKGYSADAGCTFQHGKFQIGWTAFFLMVDDWILWSPGSDGIYRPNNIKKVLGKGMEWTALWRFESPGLHWKISGKGQWSATRNEAFYGGNAASLNKQLPYTPQFSAAGGIWCNKGNATIAYLHQFTGKRFTNSDQTEYLKSYYYGSWQLQYQFQLFPKSKQPSRMHIELGVDNAWNTTFMSLANRPMPGRSWQAGFLLEW